jgi:uncharacterized membrane protein
MAINAGGVLLRHVHSANVQQGIMPEKNIDQGLKVLRLQLPSL